MRYKKKQNRKKHRRVVILITSLILLLAYILFLSPIFKIRAVEVSGNREVSEEEIKNSFTYGNIFLVSENKIKNDLIKKIPKIGDLEIKKNLIKRIVKLIVKERGRLGITCQVKEEIENCFYVDKQGVIFEQAPQTSGSLILLIKDYSQREYEIGKKIFEQEIVDFISQAREGLSSEIGLMISDFNILSFPAKDLKAITGEGWYIIFDLEGDIKSQLLALKAALIEKIKDRESLEYVDLRIENRIYYK